ncbi:hypothetical protein JR316_0007661 [Psilocybe cubensis]|nr:hypothetical protein JR316_0007661 [Psilocybe cubensis]KAH9479082.1 hypothetical protein JR316_0007661 [Psilocybe cubensis]
MTIRSAETKNLLAELSKDLASSNQVNDMLRDKLHHMGSQICEAQERIKELEEEKRGALKDIVAAQHEERRHFEKLMVVEESLAQLSQKLAVREKETIDALASSTSFQTKLESSMLLVENTQKARESLELELHTLRSERDTLASNLLDLQNTISIREKDLATAKVELTALAESKAELRALLAESKKDLSEKIVELQNRDPNIDLQNQICSLQTEVQLLQTTLRELRGTETVLQKNITEAEKANAQLLERNQQLQESLRKSQLESDARVPLELMNEKTNILNNQVSALKQEIKELTLEVRDHEKAKSELVYRNRTLQESLERSTSEFTGVKEIHTKLTAETNELKERLNVQSGELFRCKQECAIAKERQISLEKQLSLTESSLKQMESGRDSVVNALETRVEDLKVKLDQVTAELMDRTRELAAQSESLSGTEARHQLETDRMIEDLEQRILQHVKSANEIVSRYRDGNLTDVEKELVGVVLRQAEHIHAEEVVKKDNELHRRQRVVEDLKIKIAESQKTIARLLKEKAKELPPDSGNKSIFGFKAWVSSSPADAHDAAKGDKNGRDHGKMPSPVAPSPTSNPIPLPQNPVPTSHHTAPSVNARHVNVDSEDDTPLSELSSISQDSAPAMASGQKRIHSRPPSALDEPNPAKRRTASKITIAPSKPALGQSAATTSTNNKKAPALDTSISTKSKAKKRK